MLNGLYIVLEINKFNKTMYNFFCRMRSGDRIEGGNKMDAYSLGKMTGVTAGLLIGFLVVAVIAVISRPIA